MTVTNQFKVPAFRPGRGATSSLFEVLSVLRKRL